VPSAGGQHRLGGRQFGVGKRISIRHTRNLLNARWMASWTAWSTARTSCSASSPLACPDVPEDVLMPEPVGAPGRLLEKVRRHGGAVYRELQEVRRRVPAGCTCRRAKAIERHLTRHSRFVDGGRLVAAGLTDSAALGADTVILQAMLS